VDEVLTDVADDLFDYEKDVAQNSFNVLRGAVHAFGEEAPLRLAAEIGRLEREHEAALQALPEGQRAAYCRCRADAMARRPRSGKWVFPRVLLPAQEEAHRAALLRGGAGGLEGGGGSDSDSSSS